MSISMPAEGAAPTEKSKKSCKVKGTSPNINQAFKNSLLAIFFIQTAELCDRIGLLVLKGSLTFTHAAASTKDLLKTSNKRHTCDALGALPGQRVNVVMSRTPESRTLSSSHTV